MEIFSKLQALCEGNSTVTGEFPTQRPVTQSFDVFLDLCLNNSWANHRDTGDLKYHRAHYNVTVMETLAIQKQTIFSQYNDWYNWNN